MFEPTHLESFLAVAQTRNFTEAGRRLGLQQSTISQHVRKLEAAAVPGMSSILIPVASSATSARAAFASRRAVMSSIRR